MTRASRRRRRRRSRSSLTGPCRRGRTTPRPLRPPLPGTRSTVSGVRCCMLKDTKSTIYLLGTAASNQ